MTVICFTETGRPYWKTVSTKEYQNQFFGKECNYTEFDKNWFRKPLTKGANT